MSTVPIAWCVQGLCRADGDQSDTAEYCTYLCCVYMWFGSVALDSYLYVFQFHWLLFPFSSPECTCDHINNSINHYQHQWVTRRQLFHILSNLNLSLFWNNVACTDSSHNNSCNIDWLIFFECSGRDCGNQTEQPSTDHNVISTYFFHFPLQCFLIAFYYCACLCCISSFWHSAFVSFVWAGCSCPLFFFLRTSYSIRNILDKGAGAVSSHLHCKLSVLPC